MCLDSAESKLDRSFDLSVSLDRHPRISSIDLNEKAEPRTAVVHFEKPSAAKTALIVSALDYHREGMMYITCLQLNGGSLDGAHLVEK